MTKEDFVDQLNNLCVGFPSVSSIESSPSDLGGTIESVFLETGEIIDFYLTEEDSLHYLASILSYYTLSQLLHITSKFNRVTHNIDLDRASKIVTLKGSSYSLMDFIPSRSKFSDPRWDQFKEIVGVLESNLISLKYDRL